MRRQILGQFYDRALNGLPVLGTPEAVAERYRLEHLTPDEVAEDLTQRYVMLCGTTGFVCGLPGYVTMPVTIPSNVAGVLLLQSHLCAALAVLGGHDPRDTEVRRRAIECLRGRRETETAMQDTAERRGAGTADEDDTKGLVNRLATKLGERGVRLAGEQATKWMGRTASSAGRGARSLPLLGGIVGGLTDGYTTRQLGRRARDEFVLAGRN